MKVSDTEPLVAQILNGGREFGRRDAEGRPTDRPVPGLFRPRTVAGTGAAGCEEVGRGVSDRPGSDLRGESARAAASARGGQSVPVDAVAEGGPRPRPGRLLQNLHRPEGRPTDQRGAVELISRGPRPSVRPLLDASPPISSL